MIVALSTQSAIGLLLAFLAVLIGVWFAFINFRQGRPEIGSEIELAPNRKPYLSDEELEGPKLDRTLTWGLLGLFVIGIGLPLYWLAEPGRQEGAVERIQREFIGRGAEMYAPTDAGGYDCAFCHGAQGEGGATPYVVTDAEGRFLKEVTWQGPALNTVFLRMDREQIRYVLEYGRPFSPMPAWGEAGGGPLTEQQLQNLIDYMETFQISLEESQAEVSEQLEKMMALKDPVCVDALVSEAKQGLTADEAADFDNDSVDTDSCENVYENEGDALFNMGYDDGFAGGAYSCGRCHTPGWSYGDKGLDGAGAMGPNLRGTENMFPGGNMGFQQQVDFVCTGSREGARYGSFGMGTGRMPAFCIVPAIDGNSPSGEVGFNTREAGIAEDGAMFTLDQVRAVVAYERSLGR